MGLKIMLRVLQIENLIFGQIYLLYTLGARVWLSPPGLDLLSHHLRLNIDDGFDCL